MWNKIKNLLKKKKKTTWVQFWLHWTILVPKKTLLAEFQVDNLDFDKTTWNYFATFLAKRNAPKGSDKRIVIKIDVR